MASDRPNGQGRRILRTILGRKPERYCDPAITRENFLKQQRDLRKARECERLGIARFKVTVFDLTERRFPIWRRAVIAAGKAHTRARHPDIHERLVHTAVRLGTMTPPDELFHAAERLSRRRFRPTIPQRGSRRRRLLRLP